MIEYKRFIGFKYTYSEAAQRDIKKLDRQITTKTSYKLDALVKGKGQLNVKMMVDFTPPRSRLRVGNYRVIFEESRKEIIIEETNVNKNNIT